MKKQNSMLQLLKETFEREKMVSMKNSKEFLSFIGLLSWRVVSLATMCSIKDARARIKMIHNFGRYLLLQNKRKGPAYVISYLKFSQLALSKFIAGQPVSSMMELDDNFIYPRLAHGIPKIIGTQDRRSLRHNNRQVIILWMSILGIFRVIASPYVLKLATITTKLSSEHSEGTKCMERYFQLHAGKILSPHQPPRPCTWEVNPLKVDHLETFSSSSPSSKISWQGFVIDARYLKRVIEAPLREWFLLTESSTLEKLFEWINSLPIVFDQPKNPAASGHIGQLQFVKEAAGKVRVFAMVDVWTQSLLRPLHEILSSILKSIPNDGTFSQDDSYRRAREKSVIYGCSFGYDLSAATDRLPVLVQVPIVQWVLYRAGFAWPVATRLALLWKELLVGRSYFLPQLQKGISHPGELPDSVRYEVGQPMGALSSFNMLGLTHHLIVQKCAIDLGLAAPNKWCVLYEITGDDIVIFNKSLAGAYLEATTSIGLEINQKKSVVASDKAAGEYLKKTWVRYNDVSMISWKQLYQNHFTLMGRVSDALYFIQKWGVNKYSPSAIIQRAAFTWVDRLTYSAKKLHVPVAAIISTIYKTTKVPVEDVLHLFWNFKDSEFEYRSIYRGLPLTLNTAHALSIIRTFVTTGRFSISDTLPDYRERRLMMETDMVSIKHRLADKLVELQTKLGDPSFIFGNIQEHTRVLPGVNRDKGQPRGFPTVRSLSESLDYKTKENNGNETILDWDNYEILSQVLEAMIYEPHQIRIESWIDKIRVKYDIYFPCLPIMRLGDSLDKDSILHLTLAEMLEFQTLLESLNCSLVSWKEVDKDRRNPSRVSLALLRKLKPYESGIMMRMPHADDFW